MNLTKSNPPNLNFFFVSFIILESNRWYMLNKWSIFKENHLLVFDRERTLLSKCHEKRKKIVKVCLH